jgi:hypothetical protein
MPRKAVAQEMLCVVAALCAFAGACDDDRPIAPDAAAPKPPMLDASHDASLDDSGSEDDSGEPEPPWSRWDGGFNLDDLEDEYCVLRVAAECDGYEDCGSGVCCARFDPSEVSYTAIECADSCDYQRTFPLCHAGQRCDFQAMDTCRTSLLIPHDFIGVCAPPNGFSGPPTGAEVEGMINCGDAQCVVGLEQCCLREGFDVKHLQPKKYEPYCAPIGAKCDCTEEIPSRDAGMSLDDAGL